MERGFACPECGRGITPRGLTPGREVICPGCSTLVEVPYLPRAASRPRRRDRRQPGAGRGGANLARRRSIRRWAAGAAVLMVAAATCWAVASIGSRARAGRERDLRDLIAASDAAVAAGDPGTARREMAAAVSQARRADPTNLVRLDDLLGRRDHLARAEVLARLAALGNLGADQATAEAEGLARRARLEPALAPLAGEVAAAVDVATRRQVEADRVRARAGLAAGRGGEAFAAAARMYDHAGQLEEPAAANLQADARALAIDSVRRFGVVTPPASPGDVPGAGAPPGFAVAAWLDALTARGYLLPPSDPGWTGLWAVHAPYQATCQVAETHEGLYLQSQNRVTQIDGRFGLGSRGEARWQARVFAQTRAPLPDLPAYLAGKLATAGRRDPEIERRLRDDARAAWRLQAERNFRGIPAAPVPVAEPGSPADSRPPR